VKGAVAIVLAAGEGERIGRGPKAFLELSGRPILAIAAEAAAACPEIDGLVVAVPSGFEDRAAAMVPASKPASVMTGGRSRQDSVRMALERVPEDVAVVVCHDAARPFAAPELFTSVIAALSECDGAVPGLTPPDTVKQVRDGYVEATLRREDLRLVQTPQAFRAPALREAHERAAGGATSFTDDAGLLEWAGYRVRVVAGEPVNFKVTSPDDLARAERFFLESHPVGSSPGG
jgi:2-C-methyl-D-erythritol 4-phosphate cytidylyltransferase